MKLGVYGRFPLKYFYRKAEKVVVETNLKIEPLQLEVHLDDINRIDREILKHTREIIYLMDCNHPHWICLQTR